MSEHTPEPCTKAREKLDKFAKNNGMNQNQLIGWSIAADFAEWYANNELAQLRAGMENSEVEIKAMQEEIERLTKENRSMMIEQQSQFDLDGAEITKLREDKARLIGALKETTKFLGTSASLIIGTLKYTNEQLLTEMEGK